MGCLALDISSEKSKLKLVYASKDKALAKNPKTVLRVLGKDEGAEKSRIDYYPFGMLMPGRQYNSGEYRFGFGSMEKDHEIKGSGNSYDFGARIYDPRLGRWISPDPYEMRFAGVTTYRFGLNNPIFFIDPAGETEYTFHTRNFIPDARAGMGMYRGDNRGFTTQLQVTSRVNHKVTLDTEKAALIYLNNKTNTWSDPTKMYASPWTDRGIERTASPTATYSEVNKGEGGALGFNTSYHASDPLGFGVAPDIDFTTNFSVTEDLENGVLSVTGAINGDQYPAIESFITDEAGNSVFIGVRGGEGNITDSYGTDDNNLINVNIKINIDGDGNFTGVQSGDKTYNLQEWNSQFESQSTEVKDED